MYLIFAGRRWRVKGIDEAHKIIEVAPASGGRPPLFGSSGSAIHHRVRERMKAIYRGRSSPAFLDPIARDLLLEAREHFDRLRLDEVSLVGWGRDTVVFPWADDRVHATLALLVAARGLTVMPDGIALTVVGVAPGPAAECFRDIAEAPTANPTALARMAPNKAREKYDYLLGDDLLALAYASSQLDPVTARQAAARISQPTSSPEQP
jgi:ATP-dependent Lhr-like helicase